MIGEPKNIIGQMFEKQKIEHDYNIGRDLQEQNVSRPNMHAVVYIVVAGYCNGWL